MTSAAFRPNLSIPTTTIASPRRGGSRPLDAPASVATDQPVLPLTRTTLDAWAESLQANKDQAIAIQSQEVYDRYTVYLTGCADLLRQKHIDVNQFTMEK